MRYIRQTLTILGIVSALGVLAPEVLALPAQTVIAQTDAEALFQQGIDKISAGDYQGAIEALTKVLQSNPEDAEAYYNRGIALAQLEEYEKAIADYSKVLELSPDDAEAYDNRAIARAELEDYPGAIADYTQVIRRKPDDAEAYYNRGLSRAQLEDYDAAIQDLQKAAELYTAQGQTAEAEEARSVAESLQKYPDRVQRQGIEGDARVSFDVDENGRPVNVRVVRSSGNEELDRAVVEEVRRRWRDTSPLGR